MKLIPKARPVRIRILSGGIEHSSLTSLKEHFSLEDVMGLIANGSLTRWLKQCGESDLAGMIECASENDKMEVLRAFFPELGKIKSEIELVKYLYHSGQKDTAAYLFNSDLINDINAIKQAWMYYIGGINYFPLFNEHWEEDGELAFLFARACANGEFKLTDRVFVATVLEKAIELGSRQAMKFQESDVWQEYIKSNCRFPGVFKEKITSYITDILSQNKQNFDFGIGTQRIKNNVKKPNTNNDAERDIVNFVEVCYNIIQSQKYVSSVTELLGMVKAYKRTVSKDCVLIPEITLVEVLLGGNGWEKIKTYVDKNPLADLYINKSVLQKLTLRDKIKFILEHLFDDKIEV